MIKIVRNNIKTLIPREELQKYAMVNGDLHQDMATFVNVSFIDEEMQDLFSKYEYIWVFVNCHFMNCSFLNLPLTISNLNFFNCAFHTCGIGSFETCAYRFSSCNFDGIKLSRNGHAQWPKYYECNFSDVEFEDSKDYSKLNTTFSDCDYVNCSGPVPFRSRCPVEGSFIAYKAINGLERSALDKNATIYVAKLLIPEDAKRLSAGGSKCRASKAKVLDILDLKGIPLSDKELSTHYFCSIYHQNFAYRKGGIVGPEFQFDPDPWHECSSGIHFFMTFEEAASYAH